jgi:drug/metabolite transporter (DMT)-like permease
MPFLGEISALMTALLWSGTSIAFSGAAGRIGSLQLNINRLVFAAVFLYATILVTGASLSLSGAQIFYLSISGIIGLVIGDSFLFRAYQFIGARNGMLLMSLAPALTAIMAYFFLGEVVSLLGVIGMFVTIAGIALVVLEKKEIPTSKYKIDKMGIFLGFMAALGQAAGLIFAKFAFNCGHVNSFSATFVRIISSVIVILPIAVLSGKYKNPFKLFRNDNRAFVMTLSGTILGPYLGITCSLVAITYAKVGIAATLMSTPPIIMLPIAVLVEKEKLTWQGVTGAFLAVAGIAILFVH